MATEAEDALADLYEGRAEAGLAGFRPYSVALCNDYHHPAGGWSGPVTTPITEADNQPPKVVWDKQEDVAFGNAPADIITVGPITPIGTNLTILDELAEAVEADATRHILITGPGMLDGRRYRVLAIDRSRALRVMIRAQAESQALQGFG